MLDKSRLLVLVLTFSKKLKHIETEHRSDVEFRYIVYSQLVADIGKPVPARGSVEIHAYAYAAGDEQPEYALQIHCQVEAVGHQAAGATEFVVGDVGLVEEGEVIYNDYVFSNRLTADKSLLKKNNIPSSYNDYTFAKIAEKMTSEAKERPNDRISTNGV